MRGLRAAARRAWRLFVVPYLPFLIVFGIAADDLRVLPGRHERHRRLGRASAISRGRSVTSASSPRSSTSSLYTSVWLGLLIVFVVGLALLLHGRANRVSATFRFLFYIPARWPARRPSWSGCSCWTRRSAPVRSWCTTCSGRTSSSSRSRPGKLPFMFAMIAFWTGAGGWIVVMYGALNTIPHDLEEAARIDGAGPSTIALRLKLPLIRKWIAYMAILVVRDRNPAVRRAATGQPGEPRNGPRHLVVESARLPDGLPVRGLQRPPRPSRST